MPYAWTGRIDMSIDGSGGCDYCYIGFEGRSPFMANYLPGDGDLTVYFPYFYESFIISGESVWDSLDDASWNTYGCAFSGSDLYNGYWLPDKDDPTKYWRCCMRVFGDASMTLPSY
jgi:hypothetical protein